MPPAGHRIGFISTRFSGTDGVSLETAKWVAVLERRGDTCFYFAGLSDRPAGRSRVVPEAFSHHPSVEAITQAAFAGDWGTATQARAAHPEIVALYKDSFSMYVRPPQVTRQVQALTDYLKEHLYAFTRDFELELLIVENALALPINLPLGLALTEFIAETGYPTIAHHHDFHWEHHAL